MAYAKDLERLVRAFLAQKLEIEYIRHYLMENYQMDQGSIDQLLTKLGVKLVVPRGTKVVKEGAPKGPDKTKVDRDAFY